MARMVVYPLDTDVSDRSLIEYLYKCKNWIPGWQFEKDSLSDHLSIPGSDVWFSLVIRADGELIAGIPEGKPFKIMMFDQSSIRLTAIQEMVKKFKSKKKVHIEIQK
jgi:hypothetical protein